MTDETDDTAATDQWTNTIGADDELDRLWAALMEATASTDPKTLQAALTQHLAGLGARARRTTEGLILAAIAATAAITAAASEGPAWDDFRVILHRHFVRDERMDATVAVAILLELRKYDAVPDWHAASERVMERVIGSLVRDMRLELEAIDHGPEAIAASGSLATLASELFDVAIALTEDQTEELQNSPAVAALLAELGRELSGRADADLKAVANNLMKARALVEVTIRQLELGAAVVH